MNLVVSRIHKRDRALSRQGAYPAELFRMLVDLRSVAAAKFLPAAGIVTEPFPQRYPSAILRGGALVRSFQLDVAGRDCLFHQHRSEMMAPRGWSAKSESSIKHGLGVGRFCANYRILLSRGDRSLKLDLGAKAVEISVNDGRRELPAAESIGYGAVSSLE